MITEEQIDALIERIVNKLDRANTYLLKQMGQTINKISKLSPTEAQKLVNILKSGGDFYEIINQLTEYTGLSVNEIDEIFTEYAKKDYSFYRQFYQYRNKPFLPFEENTSLLRQTKVLSDGFKREMYNYLRPNVLGYSIRNAQGQLEFLGLKETYNRVIDEALINISQGKQTFDSAMSQIMKDIGGSGLKTLDYESGRSYRLDSMARMHLNDGLRTLHNKNQEIIGEQFDYNGIEVTHHENAAPDHIDTVDGKQFALVDRIREQIIRGIEKQIKTEDIRGNQVWVDGKMYDDFNAVNDSLQRQVSTLNCRHTTFSIILGVSKPRYTEEQLEADKQKNLDGCIIDGKHYTLYEASQLQRQLERKVREQKDIQIMAKSAGNNDLVLEAQSKITQYTNKYKELSDISGLPTYNERMRVSGYKKIKSGINKETDNKIIYKDYFKEYWYKSDEEKYGNVVAVDDLFEERYKPIYEKWNDETKSAFKNYAGPYYKDINKTLAGKDLGDTDNWVGLKDVHSTDDYKTKINEWIGVMDKEINKNPINENITLWKGTSSDYYKDLKVGDEFSSDLYLSTSLDRSIAETFMWNKEGAVALKINCPADTKAMYMGGDFGLGEAEMLLGRKQKFKILRTYEEYGISYEFERKKQKIKIIEVEVIK